MVSKVVRIPNKLGLHARPAAMLVTAASKFQAELFITKDGLRVNGKSIMGVMMLAAEMGSELTIEADGPDEQDSLNAVSRVVESGFGEMG